MSDDLELAYALLAMLLLPIVALFAGSWFSTWQDRRRVARLTAEGRTCGDCAEGVDLDAMGALIQVGMFPPASKLCCPPGYKDRDVVTCSRRPCTYFKLKVEK